LKEKNKRREDVEGEVRSYGMTLRKKEIMEIDRKGTRQHLLVN
jgi:hypothetical protein